MFRLEINEIKDWLRLDHDFLEEDELLYGLMTAAESYLLTATGRTKFGHQTHLAKLVCKYLIVHWYEDRSFYNPSPQTVKKPIITMMITQLQYGTGVITRE